MSGVIRRLTGRWWRPRSLIIAAAIAIFSASGLVAWAAWSSQGNGPGAAKSLSMPGGNTPTASVSGTTVTVGWSASVFANGIPVQGYRIHRYAQGSTTAITPGANCGGAITALTCAENAVPGGSWQYTVTPYQGRWTGAESPKSQPVTVSTGGPIATTTTVHSSGTPSVFGQLVTFTATVSPAPPAGETVTFADGATSLGSAVLNTSGSATFSTSSLTVGSHTISVTYAGDSSFVGSNGSTVQVVNKASAAVAVTSSDSLAVFGESVSFTATVTAVAPGAGTVDGTVQFQVDGVNLGGAVTLTGGTATSIATTTLSVGSHTVTAVYSGSANFNGATGTLTQSIGKAGTTTALTSAPNPSVFGQMVTFTATVSAVAPGAGTPGGASVTFTDGGSTLGTASLSGGSATFMTSALSVGSHTIGASYAGDPNFNGSTATSITQIVGKANTTTLIVSSVNPSVFGQGVIFTATVAAVAPGAGSPSGSVQFHIDGANFGSPATLLGGRAFSDSATALSVGPHTVTATYGGNGNFNGSTSADLTQTVTKASAATLVTASSANPSVFGQAVTFTATVTAMPPGAGTPTGTVQFSVGLVNLGGPVTLSGGTATSPAISSLPVGTSAISASYSGDSHFLGSASPSFIQTVNKDATTTTVTSSANPSLFGQSVNFTATVSANAPGSGTPTGTVTFSEGGTTLGTGTLSSGSATFTTSALPSGNHTITASYGGDGNFLTSVGSVLQAVGNQVPTTTTINSSSNPSVWGQPVTFTANVTVNAPGSGTPTGTVTFTDGTATLGSVTLSAGGTATFMTADLSTATTALPTHTITATYSGDGNFASSSASLSQTVNRADTTISLSIPITTLSVGEALTFTTTVSVVAPGAGYPTGTMILFDGTTDFLAGSINATFDYCCLGPGTHSLTAQYRGDGNFKPSTSPVVIVTVGQSTVTAVSSAPNPSVFGQNVTFTAIVTPTSPGSVTPTGTVTFTKGSTTLGTGTLNSAGEATYSSSSLATGVFTVMATYNGDVNYPVPTRGTMTQTINKASTSTTIVPSNNPSLLGQSVTFIATVTAVAPGAGTPSGPIWFLDGANVVDTEFLDSNGQAAFAISSLTAGTHTITASFLGGIGFSPSDGSVAQVVNGNATIAISPTTAISGSSVTVSGSGWPANDTNIQVFIGPLSGYGYLCTVGADASGAFSQSCLVNTNLAQGTYAATATDGAITVTGNAVTVNPAITYVNPTYANPTNMVTISGSGFAANSNLTITLGGVAVTPSVTITGSLGGVNLTFNVPSGTAAGATTITVTDSASPPNSASIAFTVFNATIAISPTTVTWNSSVTVSGTGWPANDTGIQVYIGPLYGEGFVCYVGADATGAFSTSCLMTSTGLAQGTYTATASDSSITTGGNQVTVNPVIFYVSPTYANPTNPVQVVGVSFAANSNLTVKLGAVAVTPSLSSTDARGGVNVTFNVPSSTPAGATTITVTDSASPANSASIAFTVYNATISVSPTTVSRGGSVTVSGSGWPAATGVGIAVYIGPVSPGTGFLCYVYATASGVIAPTTCAVPTSTPTGTSDVLAYDGSITAAGNQVTVN